MLLLFFVAFQNLFSQIYVTTKPLMIDETKSTIRTRFEPPEGFSWVNPKSDSFAEFLTNFPLHPAGFPVRDFTKVPIEEQHHHVAILKINVGEKNLQQCADAWIRLYAEYLWIHQRFDEIGFEFTSTQFFAWDDYKIGFRTKEVNKKVSFVNTGKFDDSYENFQKYLEVIFRYAGTISLDVESNPIENNTAIKAGDFIIKPGSPGHLVMIVGVAKNPQGKKLYLLAESYMPAQDIHVLVNHDKPKLSPWYELDVNARETITAKYIFNPTSIKRFHALP